MSFFIVNIWILFLILHLVYYVYSLKIIKAYTTVNYDTTSTYKSFVFLKFIVMSIPWLILGVGIVFRITDSTYQIFSPISLNPFVIAFYLYHVIVFALMYIWVNKAGGDQFLKKYPGLFQKSVESKKKIRSSWNLRIYAMSTLIVLIWVVDFLK